ncbi:hypothetical protein DSO57_1015873 [Entomophthora muscae]|uniref:Uncharacterized protein n=1 Tax=Entomophthora muscae TaxID=34485 RepID=A0ACC2RJN7_9FUNG|nr:hypothetical protein DSO57_1015873 [Entomophthora muscae]
MAAKAQALNVFVYSKIWYVTHIMPFSAAFEKKVEPINRAFFWKKATAALIRLELVTRMKKEDGIGLLPVTYNTRRLWGKSFLAGMNTHKLSPAKARTLNWLDSLCPISKENQTLQTYLATHQGI